MPYYERKLRVGLCYPLAPLVLALLLFYVKVATADDFRTVIDLDGHWKITQISDTSGNSWKTVDVPSQLGQEGKYSLRKQFQIDDPAVRSHVWILSTDGIGGNAQIFINGREAGDEMGGGIPRQLVVPAKFLRRGINEIDVQISSVRAIRGTIPLYAEPLAPNPQSGILGSIQLSKCGSGAIVSCRTVTHADDNTIDVRALVAFAESPGNDLSVRSLLYDHQSGAVLSAGASATCDIKPDGTCEIAFVEKATNPRDWDIHDRAEIDIALSLDSESVTIDNYKQTCGFRRFTIANKRSFLLNGIDLQLQGVEYIEVRGNSQDAMRSAVDHDLDAIQQLGVNTLRLPVAPSEYLLQQCDARGILVMVELPISGAPGHLLADEKYLKQAEDLAASYRNAYFNHPCVIALGLGSDNDDVDSRTEKFYTALANSIKSLEPSAGVLYYFVSRYPSDRFALDFAALSAFGVQSDLKDRAAILAFAEAHKGSVPVVLAGSGRLVTVEKHSGGDTSYVGSEWSVSSQARSLFLIHREAEGSEFAGSILSTFQDYQTSLPVISVETNDRFLVSGGLRNGWGIERPAFAMVQALFHAQKAPGYSSAEDPKVSTIPFLVYAFTLALLFFILINLDRRFREYVNRALVRPFNFFADIRDQRLIPNAQSLLLAWLVGGSWATVLGGILFGFRETYSAGWVLRMLVHSRWLLKELASLAWSPWMLLFVGSAVCTSLLFLLAGVIRFAAIFVRQRIFYNDTLNVAVWALMPSIVLLPLGIVVPRLDPTAFTITVTLWVLLVLKIWLLYRLMKGVGVLFDIYPTKIYLYCGTGIVILYLLILFYLNFRYALFSNWDFVLHLSKA